MRLLAIDGGGTKTDVVLFAPDGTVIAKATAGGCNPNDIGFENSCAIIKNVVSEVTRDHDGLKIELCGGFAGLSGGSFANYLSLYKDFFHSLLPNAKNMANHSDAVAAINSGMGREDGCVLISGTGSIAYRRCGDEITKIGGLGYLIDKGGSGYDFGRDLLYHVFCENDGRGEHTLLTELLTNHTGMSLSDTLKYTYQKGKPFIASLTPLVFDAYRQQDNIAKQILQENSKELAKLINTLIKKGEKQIVMTGSIFKDFEDLKTFLLPQVKGNPEFIFPKNKPIYGSMLEAMYQAKLSPSKDFEKNFVKTI